MAQVEITRFDSDGVTHLAARFLQAHGITASAPSFPYSGSIGSAAGSIGETPLLVEESQFDEASLLLNRVIAGDFADEDPARGTRGGLGAALAEALLPDPTFRQPTRLQALAPLIAIIALPAIGLVGVVILTVLRG